MRAHCKHARQLLWCINDEREFSLQKFSLSGQSWMKFWARLGTCACYPSVHYNQCSAECFVESTDTKLLWKVPCEEASNPPVGHKISPRRTGFGNRIHFVNLKPQSIGTVLWCSSKQHISAFSFQSEDWFLPNKAMFPRFDRRNSPGSRVSSENRFIFLFLKKEKKIRPRFSCFQIQEKNDFLKRLSYVQVFAFLWKAIPKRFRLVQLDTENLILFEWQTASSGIQLVRQKEAILNSMRSLRMESSAPTNRPQQKINNKMGENIQKVPHFLKDKTLK